MRGPRDAAVSGGNLILDAALQPQVFDLERRQRGVPLPRRRDDFLALAVLLGLPLELGELLVQASDLLLEEITGVLARSHLLIEREGDVGLGNTVRDLRGESGGVRDERDGHEVRVLDRLDPKAGEGCIDAGLVGVVVRHRRLRRSPAE